MSSQLPTYRSIFYAASLFLVVLVSMVFISYKGSNIPTDESASSSLGINIGIIGDSGSDEYRADDNRGGAYAATTLNWLEQFIARGDAYAGPWGTRSEPRRSGFEYNWARSDAVAVDANVQGAGLAQQVSQGKVNFVVVWLGANDFADYHNAYGPIYNGTTSSTSLANKINNMATNIENGTDLVMAAGSPKLVVISVPDWGMHPSIIKKYPDASKRQRVTNAVSEVNTRLQALANKYDGLYIHIDDYAIPLLAQLNQVDFTFKLEGETIKFLQIGDEPHHLILGDNIHGGTIAEGLMLQYMVTKFNAKWNLGIPAVTNQEILRNAGIIVSTICSSDIDESGITDITDYSFLVTDFLSATPLRSRSDINRSGFVDIDDYSLLVNTFFKTSC